MTEFFYYDEVWNSLIQKEGKNYRERVELLLLDKEGNVFIGRKSSGCYTIPGGSTEPDVDLLQQVINECTEEALIVPKNVQYVSTYTRMYGDDYPLGKWMASLPVHYDGMIIHLFIGEYDKQFEGFVEQKNRSAELAKGQFVSPEAIADELVSAHKAALHVA